MSCDSPLTSPLHQLSIPLALVTFPRFLFPSTPPFYLPQCLPFCPSARLFKHASQARGRRVCECQTSQNACCKHKELLWRWGQICLNWICSLSPLLVFSIPSVYRGPLFFPVLLFPLCPTANLISPSSKPLRCFLCKTFITVLVEKRTKVTLEWADGRRGGVSFNL